jgi:hypothetical protein
VFLYKMQLYTIYSLMTLYIVTVLLKGLEKIWTGVSHRKSRENACIIMNSETLSSVIFNTCLETSCQAKPHLFKDSGVVADSLAGTNNAMV